VFDTAVIASFPDDTEGRVQGALFNGVLDGNSHTISNFSCTSTRTGFIGLFGCVLGRDANISLNPAIFMFTGHRAGLTADAAFLVND